MHIRRLMAMALTVGFVGLTAALGWLGVRMADARLSERGNVHYLYEEYLLRARALSRMSRDTQAFGYFKMAIDAAPNEEARAEAGTATAEFLLKLARNQTRPYAIMARQYLEAALDLTDHRSLQLQIYEGLYEIGQLLGDLDIVKAAGGSILELSKNENTRFDVLLTWMDLCLEKGTLTEMEALLERAEVYEDKNPAWNQQIALRRADMDAQILMRPDWTHAFFKSATEEEAELLRASLVDETLDQYRVLVEEGDRLVQEDSLYKMAELCVYAGRLKKGREYLHEFLLREPATHLDEALLLMTRIARLEGQTETADQMISRFLKRYGVQQEASRELLALLSQMEQEGRIKAALELVEEYLQYPLNEQVYAEFLARAAHLAAKAGAYLEGEKFMDELLTLDLEAAKMSVALLEQADACIASGAYPLAEKWLLKHLEMFPNDPLQGECLFKLYDVKRDGGGKVTDVMLTGMAAIEESPSDIRSLETLISLARMLEEVGLYDLAQVQYSKVGLLRMTNLGQGNARSDVMGNAVLGSARCLLKMGKVVQADHILREICNNYGPGAVRSEAAYLWATIARENGQVREAKRRLALAELGDVDEDLAARIMFEKNLLDIASGKGTPQGLAALGRRLTELDSEADLEFARRAYIFCFDQLARANDLSGMQELLDMAIGRDFSGELPLRIFCLKLASRILARDGVDAFVTFMDEYQSLFEGASEELRAGIQQMLDNIEYMEEAEKIMGVYL